MEMDHLLVERWKGKKFNLKSLLLCVLLEMDPESFLPLDDLEQLVQELEPVKEWFTLGLYLGLKDDELTEIEAGHPESIQCKREVLSRWLRKGHNSTWRRVIEVLMQMGEIVVADTIKLKYLTLTTGR